MSPFGDPRQFIPPVYWFAGFGALEQVFTFDANQIANASPSVDPAVAENDPGYQAALSQATDGWNAAQQQAQNDITDGEAAADFAAAPPRRRSCRFNNN